MYALCLVAAVLVNLLPWILNRRVVTGGVDQVKVGTVLSLTVVAVSVFGFFLTGEQGFAPVSVALGILQGICFAIGYCILILQALEIGPIALTTLFNNMGLLGPIVVGMLFFSEPVKSPVLTVLGFVLVLATMILTSLASGKKQTGGAHQVTRRWFVMVFFGWIFSSFSIAAQYVNSQLAPDCVYSYMIVAYGTAALILIGYGLRRKNGKPARADLKGGLVLGLAQTLNMVVTFAVLARVPYIVYYPVSIASPIFCVMLLGHFLYKDKMDKADWLSTVLGLVGIVLLAVFG